MKRKQRADAPGVFSKIVKRLLILMLLLNSGLQAKASSDLVSQQPERTVSGVVTDENGDSVIGATVVVKGTTIGTTTNVDGIFTLRIPSDAQTLQVSYVGMITVDITIGDNSQYNVVMKPDAVLMEDLVVIGYGTRSKKDMSIAVS